MKMVMIDCAHFSEREAAHTYLAQTLHFPAYYGKNLDALYDCLTELDDCDIVLAGAQAALNAGGYGARMVETFWDAAQGNPGLRVWFAYQPGPRRGKET